MSIYRAWGDLAWLHAQSGVSQWGLVSCLAAEERALSTHIMLQSMNALHAHRYLCIKNPSYEHTGIFDQLRNSMRARFQATGGEASCIRDFDLLGSTHFDIVEFVERELPALGESIILDVSALPKRYFFPILRRLVEKLRSGVIKNLAVTYAIPERYAEGRLAWNHGEWSQLPLFQGRYSRRKIDRVVASIGFETLGLISELEEGKDASGSAVLLLPFPSSLSWVTRCWATVEKIVRARGGAHCDVVCCDARDVSQAFERMEVIGNYGARELILAPYGPKPLSLAIALFAIKYDYPVFYTQPRHYSPQYSYGVHFENGLPLVLAYLVGLNGSYLYS